MRGKYSTAWLALVLVLPAAAQCPEVIPTLEARITKLRNVATPLAPPCRPIDRAELDRELDRKLHRDLPIPPELYITALVKLGFVTGEVKTIYKRVLEFYSSQVLGFYEPASDELVVVGKAHEGVAEEMVWAHELAHAAQEHRFKLASRLLAMRDNSDQQRAASAIAEGDAMLVMFLLERGDKGDEREVLANAERTLELTDGALPVPDGVPEYFVRELEFPYTAGFEAVLRAYRAGGWGAVDGLLKSPPATTAELLQPGRLVTGSGLAAADLPPVPPGYEEVLTDTLGEWALAFWLGRALPAAESKALAAAWDGDRLRLVRRTDSRNSWALSWNVRTTNDALQHRLQDALAKALPHLLVELDGSGRAPLLTFVSAPGSLSVRAAWPESPPSRSRSKPS
jgi:hypothetical protein